MLKPFQSFQFLLTLPVILLMAGCSTFSGDQRVLASYYEAGDIARARSYADGQLRVAPARDRMVWLLESGNAHRLTGDFSGSRERFAEAWEMMRSVDEGPAFRISSEVWATLTNLNTLPYQGTQYDRIMVSTYQALNYLALDDPAGARVELNRALDQQRRAVQQNAARIEAAREESRQVRPRGEVSFNPDFQSDSLVDRLAVQQPGLEAYADYVNPFTNLIEGIFFLYYGIGSSELERARFAFQRTQQMVPDNPYLPLNLSDVEATLRDHTIPATTHIIVENGLAPEWEENRIDLPILLVSNRVSFVGVNFPSLRFRPSPVRSLTVRADGNNARTSLVASMDKVIAKEFNQTLPMLISRSMLAAATRTAIEIGLRDATRDRGALGTIVAIGTLAYQLSMNQADLRHWVSLPKDFLYARIPTPASGKITLQPDGINTTAGTSEIQVTPNSSNLVYVRVTSSYSPPVILHLTLP